MNWKLIDKSSTEQPKGIWNSWKEIIAKEGFCQCVYCSINENRFGGTRNFTVEHYKPKSKFKDLTNIITNLFYACCICNGFKGNDWYNNSPDDIETVAYPDPSKFNYEKLFTIDYATGLLQGTCVAGKYIIQRLYLNRAQLVVDRRLSIAISKKKETFKSIEKMTDELMAIARTKNVPDAFSLLHEILKIQNRIDSLRDEVDESRPYTDEQIKKHSIRKKNK